MKIFFFAHYFPPGQDAATITTERIIGHLSKRHDLTVFVPWRESYLSFKNVKVVQARPLPSALTYTISHLFNARVALRLASKSPPDLIIGQYIPHQWAALGAYIVHRRLKKPLFLRSHDIVPVYPANLAKAGHLWLTNLVNRWVARRADLISVVSPELRNDLISLGFEGKRVELHFNATDVPDETGSGHRTARPVVFFAGSIQPEDGLEKLVEAWPIVQKNSKAELVIAGRENDLLENLRRQINYHDIRNIRLLGEIPHREVSDWIARADLCLGPLGDELANRAAIPRKVIEYMAYGKSVLSAPISPSLLQDGQTGFTIKERGRRALAEKILWILSHQAAAQEIGERARALIKKRYSWPAALRQLDSLVTKVTSGKI